MSGVHHSTDQLRPLIDLVFQDQFANALGRFHLVWASVDLITDFAIYKFLNVSAEQAHLITSGMMFGRKSRLLADLISRSNHPNKAEILGPFNKLRGSNKRDILAHSYVSSTPNSVRIYRKTN